VRGRYDAGMAIAVTDLRCERLTDPVGVGARAPRLSWRLHAGAGERDVVQHAWQIQTDDWDSGRVEGRAQSVAYAGPALGSRARRSWRVRAWTSAGATAWSEPGRFETALLEAGDWTARMIRAEAATPVVRFSRVFDVALVSDARLYVTAHGAVAVFINGHEATDEVLAPGWTSYQRRLAARAHDVTHLLRTGANEVCALVAPAWFSGRFGLRETRGLYGDHVALLAQLEARGEVVAATDTTWSASSAPYTLAEIYDGETFDGCLEAEPATVALAESDPSVIVWPAVPPIRRTQVVAPVSRTAADGVVRLDFGQNLVGRLRVGRHAPQRGSRIVMRHAEVLAPDGSLFTEPLRTAKATDAHVARGDAVEVYEPTFTFHGFRYAEISHDETAEAEAVVVHSDLERTGRFWCSNPLVQRLHDNVVWGHRGNFVSVPTDCPQRDERLGWTGDAQVFSPTASFLFDCETFWESWLADLAADQREDGCVPPVVPDVGLEIGNGAAGWGDAAAVVPWTTYQAYGDETVLRLALPSMTAWADYVFSRLDGDHRWRRDFQFGDWLDPDAPTAEPWRAKARYDLVASAYAVRTTDIVARAASVLREDPVAARYRERAALLREAWWRNYGDAAATTQTGCALAIEFALAPDPAAIGDALVRLVREAGDHLATGFLGTPLLLPALERTGHLDVAYDVLLQRTCPSWLYQVLAGATTIWERWDALRPDGSVPTASLGGTGSSMVSFNHYAYGAVADWLHRTVAGLAPGEPGYRHVVVRPRPGGRLSAAGAELMSRFGRTRVDWRVERETLRVDVEIPPNATASIDLPDGTVTETGSGAASFACSLPQAGQLLGDGVMR
jgi:alpha-L-rhamnosidase